MKVSRMSSIARLGMRAGFSAMFLVGSAYAASYDFKLVGGGNVRPAMVQAGGYICLDVTPNSDNTVTFTLRSLIPETYSRVNKLLFDLGNQRSLITKISVAMQSGGMKMENLAPAAHPFVPGLTPEYVIGVHDPKGWRDPRALRPGQFIMVSALLAPNTTFADVINSLNVGMNPATATKGLRVGVVVQHLLGKPPEGVGTINDDAGFVVRAVSARCQGR